MKNFLKLPFVLSLGFFQIYAMELEPEAYEIRDKVPNSIDFDQLLKDLKGKVISLNFKEWKGHSRKEVIQAFRMMDEETKKTLADQHQLTGAGGLNSEKRIVATRFKSLDILSKKLAFMLGLNGHQSMLIRQGIAHFLEEKQSKYNVLGNSNINTKFSLEKFDGSGGLCHALAVVASHAVKIQVAKDSGTKPLSPYDLDWFDRVCEALATSVLPKGSLTFTNLSPEHEKEILRFIEMLHLYSFPENREQPSTGDTARTTKWMCDPEYGNAMCEVEGRQTILSKKMLLKRLSEFIKQDHIVEVGLHGDRVPALGKDNDKTDHAVSVYKTPDNMFVLYDPNSPHGCFWMKNLEDVVDTIWKTAQFLANRQSFPAKADVEIKPYYLKLHRFDMTVYRFEKDKKNEYYQSRDFFESFDGREILEFLAILGKNFTEKFDNIFSNNYKYHDSYILLEPIKQFSNAYLNEDKTQDLQKIVFFNIDGWKKVNWENINAQKKESETKKMIHLIDHVIQPLVQAIIKKYPEQQKEIKGNLKKATIGNVPKEVSSHLHNLSFG